MTEQNNDNNQTPNYAEMSQEQLIELIQSQSTVMGAYQDRVTTQLVSTYEQAPQYIKDQIPLDSLKADPMGGLVQLEQMNKLYNDIAADVRKSAPPTQDPTSASPGGGSSAATPGVKTIETIADAIQLINKVRQK